MKTSSIKAQRQKLSRHTPAILFLHIQYLKMVFSAWFFFIGAVTIHDSQHVYQFILRHLFVSCVILIMIYFGLLRTLTYMWYINHLYQGSETSRINFHLLADKRTKLSICIK